MDSMRSLNTSLPRPPQSSHPPEQLLQVFKNAALSVTNLYRTAEASEHRSRQAGYQDALDELLAFLDQQDIGLADGEGWVIRRWATERLDAQPNGHAGSESDEDKMDAANPIQSDTQRKVNAERPATDIRHHERPLAQPVPNSTALSDAGKSTQEDTCATSKEKFTFRSSCQYPRDTTPHPPNVADINIQGADIHDSSPPAPSITVNVLPRPSRTPRSSRHVQRLPAARGLGGGAGTKRRVPYGEYFDLASLEGGASTKRGRAE